MINSYTVKHRLLYAYTREPCPGDQTHFIFLLLDEVVFDVESVSSSMQIHKAIAT